MKLHDFNIKHKKNDRITIIPIGDLHLGSICCDKQAFEEMLDYIHTTDNTYTLLMGDLMDAIVHTDTRRYDISTIDPDLLTPEDQIEYLIEKLKPLADKGKIIGMLEGNHEHELKKRSYIPVCKRISEAINIPFFGYQTVIRLNFRRQSPGMIKDVVWTNTLYAHHGCGGGRRTGSIVNKVTDFMSQWDCDIYLMGHVHRKVAHTETMLTVPKRGKLRIEESRKLFGVIGTFLKSYTDDESSTYIERAGYPPVTIGTIRLEFFPDKHTSEIMTQ